MPESIKKILIVGGGTAGWITAAFLNRFLDPSRCVITLLESDAIGTIGVGEATVPPLVSLLRGLGLGEDEFLRACHATYKLGIKFVDWNRGAASGVKDEVWHPFGPVGPRIGHVPLFHQWLRERRAGRDATEYTSYSLQALLGETGRAPRTAQAGSVVTAQGAYAFHLDAREFSNYLSRVATKRGVRHVVDDLTTVRLDERGFVQAVDTAGHGSLEADLYIDCTGFAGLLIEKALGDRHVDWSDLLFCDRAVVLPLPRDPQLPPYTRATALSAGWSWKIPLSHRTGAGYVYSSRFIDDDDATAELIALSGIDPKDCTPGHLRMRVGRRERFWVNNCVAIGLSAGFLEPLESTGLFLIQAGVERLLDYFPDTAFNPALSRSYNDKMAAEFSGVRDFILLHYLLNRRQDEGFWKANREAKPPDSLARTLEFYDQTGLVDWQDQSLFRETSFQAIAAGFGRLPRAHHAMAGQQDADQAWQAMLKAKADNSAIAQSLPTHAALIAAVNDPSVTVRLGPPR